MVYGYVRVSSKEQNLARQLNRLVKYGVKEKRIYADKESGKDFNRDRYQQLVRRLTRKDCIVLTSLDRLGRNYVEIQEQWRYITHELEADIIILDMPLLNTRMTPNNLTGRFIADLVLQVLSYVAETERSNIRKRQADGIVIAKAKGVKFGRSIKLKPGEFDEVLYLWSHNQISFSEAARRLQVSRSWLYRQLEK
ncbi:MAG: recombinase family protein [Megasphaera sp.]|jgi:DNA invertase Pin-like site-specific DNA recombinase|nr:recombinase family protein [Megasphaera sp.]MCI1247848.1 recombinase family protein [Megasphaera sp.]